MYRAENIAIHDAQREKAKQGEKHQHKGPSARVHEPRVVARLRVRVRGRPSPSVKAGPHREPDGREQDDEQNPHDSGGADAERVSVRAIQTTHRSANVNKFLANLVRPLVRPLKDARAAQRSPILASGGAFF